MSQSCSSRRTSISLTLASIKEHHQDGSVAPPPSHATEVLNLYLSLDEEEGHDKEMEFRGRQPVRNSKPPHRKLKKCPPAVPLSISIPTTHQTPSTAASMSRPLSQSRKNSIQASILDVFASLYTSARQKPSSEEFGVDWESFSSFSMPALTDSDLCHWEEFDSDMDIEFPPERRMSVSLPVPLRSYQHCPTYHLYSPEISTIMA
ncbi:hypothetical protein DFS34DRAFT_634135 [Phlyctochytrium arcticum]|nr:hypothetical protein DFS34DRAFT_640435 [Phlyctochytrium arcticum]KAI9091807.1 hypothetical protein DFS34DRAFT_634135 [Phlyctochytrium arcticum]